MVEVGVFTFCGRLFTYALLGRSACSQSRKVHVKNASARPAFHCLGIETSIAIAFF